MPTQIQLGDVAVAVIHKDIKNLHLSVHPPTGRVTISAPERVSMDTVRVFAISKLGWIRRQQVKLSKQDRESPREFLNRESHYVWGRRRLLKIVEKDEPPCVVCSANRLVLHVRPRTDARGRQKILDAWFRSQLREAAPALIEKWAKVMRVRVARFFLQRMRTKWGSCNAQSRSIRLNTDLAKKPRECLDYIVAHEIAHLLEPTHSARFIELMDSFVPDWRHRRELLNRLPLRHEDWRF